MAIAVDRQAAYAAQEDDVNVAVIGEVRASHEVFATEGLPGVTELLGVERPASRCWPFVGRRRGPGCIAEHSAVSQPWHDGTPCLSDQATA